MPRRPPARGMSTYPSCRRPVLGELLEHGGADHVGRDLPVLGDLDVAVAESHLVEGVGEVFTEVLGADRGWFCGVCHARKVRTGLDLCQFCTDCTVLYME